VIKFVLYLAPDGKSRSVETKEIAGLLESGRGIVWLDTEGEGNEETRLLSDVFHFHPLAVADCMSRNIHLPKIDFFEDYLFIIVHGINYHTESDILETTELCLFLGKNYIVTNHDVPLRSLAAVAQRAAQNGQYAHRGADMIAHDIIDGLVEDIMPAVNELDGKCTTLEAQIVENPKKETISSIMQLKRSILALSRVMTTQRDVINAIARGDYATVVSKKAQIYYRNIYDHVVRIEMLAQGLRDLADGVMSTYLSSVSNRLNEVMKVLSAVAAIFLPLALVAGIYGMNFRYMPELESRYGYFIVLGVIAAIGTSMAVFFKRKKWL
jgi:magnesium transporter